MSALERNTLVGGEVWLTHAASQCEGEYCCVHNPSDHHMVEWPQHWRDDRRIMERICPCGVGHPDPDDIAFIRRTRGDAAADAETVHGCCGCCAVPVGHQP